MGPRRVGKTAVLKQLADRYGGYYINFRDSKNPERDFSGIFERTEKLILLDEIGYLPDFDVCLGSVDGELASMDKKLVITGSSYGALKQLWRERRGDGRCKAVELFPPDFEEYLYFSGRISAYGEDYGPTAEDVRDYFRLEGVNEETRFLIDRHYMEETFCGTETARANYQNAAGDVYLTREQHRAVIDILSYSLNGRPGVTEFGKTPAAAELSLSDAFARYAEQESNGMDYEGVARIIAYLLYAGFLFVDLTVSEESRQSAGNMVSSLLDVRGWRDLRDILDAYEFCVTSPLLYTRLVSGSECAVGETLPERLYELTVKAESVRKYSPCICRSSYRYVTAEARAGLVEYGSGSRKGLIFETPAGHKDDARFYADKVLRGAEFIRILTGAPGVFDFNGVFYRIGYPKALLMMSNGSVYNLEACKSKIPYREGRNP